MSTKKYPGESRSSAKKSLARKTFLLFALLTSTLITSHPASSQTDNPTPDASSNLEVIVVTGRRPGPPLWRVSNGDSTLFIFGNLSPLPSEMTWVSDRIENVIAESQEYIYFQQPKAKVPLNPITMFRGLSLMVKLSKNPNGASLQDVLPEDLYQRFSILEERYLSEKAIKELNLPRFRGIEDSRPIVAANAIFSNGLRANGLSNHIDIEERIEKIVRSNKSIIETPILLGPEFINYELLENRGETIMSGLAQETEIACLEITLDSIETDLDGMKARANAWALGYVDELRYYNDFPDREAVCGGALQSSIQEVENLFSKAEEEWLAAVERALENNENTFALLNISELIKPDGLLEKLREKGYRIVEP